MIRMISPTARAHVRSAWAASRAYRGGWHEGLDFHGARGKAVRAAAAGTVVRSRASGTYAGRYVAVDHGNGLTSLYMHNQVNLVNVGDRVRQGQTVATIGSSGTVSADPHVHFTVRATPSALVEYERRYGRPTTGFGRLLRFGRAVPSEPFMSGVTYRLAAKAGALAKGVRFYKGVSLLVVGAVGFIGWGVWRLLK